MAHLAWHLAAAVALWVQAVGSATTINPARVPYCNAGPGNVNAAIAPIGPQPHLAATPELIQVQTIIRHGARAPLLGVAPPWGCTGAAWCYEQCGRFFRQDGGTGAPIVWNCQPQQLQAWSAGGAVSTHPISFSPYLETSPNPSLPGNCTEGDLVDAGYEQHAANGRVLRDAYVVRTTLLDFADLATATVRVVADHWQRTQASAQALMGGLFPCTDCMNRTDHRFRMGVIPSVGGANLELDLENFLVDSPNCGTAHSTLNHMFEAAHPAVLTPALDAVFSAMLDGTPPPPDMITKAKLGMDGAVECSTDAICNGHPLPDSVSNGTFYAAYSAKVQYEAAKWRFSSALTPTNPTGPADPVRASMAQLTVGNLTSRILAEMATAAGAAPARKLVVWSGHSETLWSFLSAVGVNVTDYPPFAAMVILELYSVPGGEPQVRALWMGSDVTSQIPGCPKTAGSLCPLPAFRAQAGLAVAVVSALCRDPPAAASPQPQPPSDASAASPGSGFSPGSMVAAVVISLLVGGVISTIVLLQLAKSGGGFGGRSRGRGATDGGGDPLRYHELTDAAT